MLENNLKNLGLTDKESAVYLEVLKRGRVSPTEIAQTSKIRRNQHMATPSYQPLFSHAQRLARRDDDVIQNPHINQRQGVF